MTLTCSRHSFDYAERPMIIRFSTLLSLDSSYFPNQTMSILSLWCVLFVVIERPLSHIGPRYLLGWIGSANTTGSDSLPLPCYELQPRRGSRSGPSIGRVESSNAEITCHSRIDIFAGRQSSPSTMGISRSITRRRFTRLFPLSSEASVGRKSRPHLGLLRGR